VKESVFANTALDGHRVRMQNTEQVLATILFLNTFTLWMLHHLIL